MTHKLLMTAPAAGGGGSFNPETDITWHSLFWAEGTDFVALGLADTDLVTTWPNETGEADATNAVRQPAYAAAVTAMNSKPAVNFAGHNRHRLDTGAFTSAPTAPYSIVIVGAYGTTGIRHIIDGTGGRAAIFENFDRWRIHGGLDPGNSGVASDLDPHLFVATFSGSVANSTLDLDGVNIIDADAGSDSLTGLILGNFDNVSAAVSFNGDMALAGLYEGDITADGSWADFKTWVTDHYGITIA